MTKRCAEDDLVDLLSDDESVHEPTEAELKWNELRRVEAEIRDMEVNLQLLKAKKQRIEEDLDAIPGARYVPTSPAYSPEGDE